jgi:endonuclease YncB( thermonuclease family)
MRVGLLRKGASGQDAPFWLWGVFFVLWWLSGNGYPEAADGCAADSATQRVRVGYVYDGDTIKLEDGRRVRLIGINTPEIGHHGQPNQDFAQQARSVLQDILDANNKILYLQYANELQDHYGRVLAHAYLEDGTNVAVRLLEQGLATTLVVPPNTRTHSCYQRHEDAARNAARGLWALPAYQPVDSHNLQPESRGFRIVHGRIMKIRQSRYSIRLELDGPLDLYINRKDLVNFPDDFPQATLGRKVVVRGWITGKGEHLRINLRHPAALRTTADGVS